MLNASTKDALSCKVNTYATKHQTSNTNKKTTVDKSTNTHPLIILESKDIQNLINGFKLISFDIPQIFLQTTDSLITLKPKFEPKYVPTPISVKPCTENESNISQIVKESMAKTKCETITKVQNLKVKREVKKPNLDKLVDKYYPRLKDWLKSKPEYAHTNKKPKIDWLAEVNATAKELDDDQPQVISSDSSSEDETSATNVDVDFRSKLDELFGPVSCIRLRVNEVLIFDC